jgi:L-ascorbate metabolism protein UlaG (beta-lactamase superfamily)
MYIKQITYCGHSAVLLQCEKDGKPYNVGIDLWITGNPSYPQQLVDLPSLNLLILTHGHSDHAADAVRLAKDYGCKVLGIFELIGLLTEEGIISSHAIGMNKGGTATVDGLVITLCHALHSSSYATNHGAVYAGEPCSVVIRGSNTTVFHSGDTALFSDLSLIGDFYKPDIGLLCIGDYYTMGPIEAAYAAKLLKLKKAIPIHYGTFDLIKSDPELFKAHCYEYQIDVEILKPGEFVKA